MQLLSKRMHLPFFFLVGVEFIPSVFNSMATDTLLWHLLSIISALLNLVVLKCAAVQVCSEMRREAMRYCSAPWCNPRYLVCSLRQLR